MHKTIGISLSVAAIAAASLFVADAVAQTATAVVGTGPGVAAGAQTIHLTAEITAIDAVTRVVTLKGPKGQEVDVTAGPEVKNFAQLQVGQKVNVDYLEALSLELHKGGGKAVARTEQAGGARAPAGGKPGGLAGHQTTIVADVIDTNAQTQTVTLKGPKRTVDLKVRDPKQFALIAKGDQVEATYTEAFAIGVSPAK
jgi:hypothetical protein